MAYFWVKWLHIVAIISWMAGVLYLFRLFVNHAEHRDDGDKVHKLLSGMEERLYRMITVPAMSVAYLAGIGMIMLNPTVAKGGWFHIKFFCVILLTVATIYGGKLMRRFKEPDAEVPTPKTLRIMNEVPTILMLIIVGMVVFRPFS